MPWIKRIISGLGIGPFVVLLLGLFEGGLYLSVKTIIFILVISIIAGLMAFVFDIERFNLFQAWLIHFGTVLLVIVGFQIIFGLSFSLLSVIGSTAIIYALSYAVLYLQIFLTSNQLNRALKKLGDRV